MNIPPKFSPEYKLKVQTDFIASVNAGHSNQELADAYFDGNKNVAEKLKRKLVRTNLIQTVAGDTPRDLYQQRDRYHRQAIREKDRTQVLCDMIRMELIPQVPVKVPKALPHSEKEERILVLNLGDIHTGQLVKPDDIHDLGAYNETVFQKRMQKLITGLQLRVLQLRRDYMVDVLEINALGDNTEGETIFTNQAAYIDLPRMGQIRACRDEMSKLLAWAAATFPTVRFRGVRGNHGRPGLRGANHYQTNWDDVLYELLKTAFKNQPNLHFLLSTTTEMLYQIPEAPQYTFCIVHGCHAEKRGLKRLLDEYSTLFSVPINYLITGHFHTAMQEDIPHGSIFINGTFTEGNTYTKDVFRGVQSPKQLLLVLNPATGIDVRYDLYLEDQRLPRLVPNHQGIYMAPIKEALHVGHL